VEICRAEFLLDVLDVNLGTAAAAKVESKLDTCGSVSLSHSSHLQQVQSCRKYGLKEVVLTGIRGKSKPLREAGVLHVAAGDGKVKKILCYKLDERVGNTERILLLSLRTIRDANIDILHHMDKSLDGISAPLLFLQDKDPTSSRKKRPTGKFRNARKFLMRQKRKWSRGNACALLLASNSQIAKEYAERGAAMEADNMLHCVCEMDEEDKWMIPSSTWNSASSDRRA
jgi:hypothetical protein